MKATIVNNFFARAWEEYEKFKEEVDAFCVENDIDPDLIKTEMSGPHVHIKHYLTPNMWTESLHDKLSKQFGVSLIHFDLSHWKGTHNEPHYVSYKWIYAIPCDDKFVLDYYEVLSI